jgi:hypothetical protein
MSRGELLSMCDCIVVVHTRTAVVISYGPPYIESMAVLYYGTVVGYMWFSYITFIWRFPEGVC